MQGRAGLGSAGQRLRLPHPNHKHIMRQAINPAYPCSPATSNGSGSSCSHCWHCCPSALQGRSLCASPLPHLHPYPHLHHCGAVAQAAPRSRLQVHARALLPSLCTWSGSLPHAQHPGQATPLSPWHADPQSTPTAFPSLLPHGTGTTRPRSPILRQKTAPQALRPSPPQRRTGTHRVEVPRCRWLRGGSPAGESAQTGLPEPCVCFWPSSCTYVHPPRGNLVQTRAEQFPLPAAPIAPGPPLSPLHQRSAADDPGTCPTGAARQQDSDLWHRWDTGQEELGPGSGCPRYLCRLAAPCPMPPCTSCPGTSRGAAERPKKGRDGANSPGAAAAAYYDNPRGTEGTGWARPAGAARIFGGARRQPGGRGTP